MEQNNVPNDEEVEIYISEHQCSDSSASRKLIVTM